MKKAVTKTAILLSTLFLFLGVEYSNFTVDSSGNNVTLSWQTGSEAQLKEIAVKRKIAHDGVYSVIETIAAKGDNSSYTFIDENAYKVEDGVYTYQLQFINNDGTSSTSKEEQSVAVIASVGKKTWGSIKALFR
jgi:hypothetical protein